jgi:hypothetical protein
MKRLLAGLAVAALAACSGAGAQEEEPGRVELPPIETGDRVVRGRPGQVIALADRPVLAELIGRGCEANASVANNVSEHPNTDIIITSGDREIVIEDVERLRDTTIDRPGLLLLLASRVDVAVRLGPDGVFSGGLTVRISCPAAVPPATTVPAPTTTTVAPPPPALPPRVPAPPPRASVPAAPVPSLALPETG